MQISEMKDRPSTSRQYIQQQQATIQRIMFVGANEKVTITDQVALKALKLGTEYTLSGTLMNAKD